MDLGALNALGEAEVRKLLQEEGKKLEMIAKITWRQYLESYTPVEYIRTGNSFRSIQLGKIERLGANELGIRLEFRDELAYHDSIFNSDRKTYKQGHAIMLISDGWAISGKSSHIYRLGYYEGFRFKEKVLKAYEKIKSSYIQVEFNWNGAYTR